MNKLELIIFRQFSATPCCPGWCGLTQKHAIAISGELQVLP